MLQVVIFNFNFPEVLLEAVQLVHQVVLILNMWWLLQTIHYLRFKAASAFNGSIDNVSVKQVRATTVEASKCLADAIHRIGIQDIQN